MSSMLEVQTTSLSHSCIHVSMCVGQHPGYDMLEVAMRQLRCSMLESVIDSDMCIADCINMFYVLFILKSYFVLILGASSSSSLLRLSQLQESNTFPILGNLQVKGPFRSEQVCSEVMREQKDTSDILCIFFPTESGLQNTNLKVFK